MCSPLSPNNQTLWVRFQVVQCKMPRLSLFFKMLVSTLHLLLVPLRMVTSPTECSACSSVLPAARHLPISLSLSYKIKLKKLSTWSSSRKVKWSETAFKRSVIPSWDLDSRFQASATNFSTNLKRFADKSSKTPSLWRTLNANLESISFQLMVTVMSKFHHGSRSATMLLWGRRPSTLSSISCRREANQTIILVSFGPLACLRDRLRIVSLCSRQLNSKHGAVTLVPSTSWIPQPTSRPTMWLLLFNLSPTPTVFLLTRRLTPQPSLS